MAKAKEEFNSFKERLGDYKNIEIIPARKLEVKTDQALEQKLKLNTNLEKALALIKINEDYILLVKNRANETSIYLTDIALIEEAKGFKTSAPNLKIIVDRFPSSKNSFDLAMQFIEYNITGRAIFDSPSAEFYIECASDNPFILEFAGLAQRSGCLLSIQDSSVETLIRSEKDILNAAKARKLVPMKPLSLQSNFHVNDIFEVGNEEIIGQYVEAEIKEKTADSLSTATKVPMSVKLLKPKDVLSKVKWRDHTEKLGEIRRLDSFARLLIDTTCAAVCLHKGKIIISNNGDIASTELTVNYIEAMKLIVSGSRERAESGIAKMRDLVEQTIEKEVARAKTGSTPESMEKLEQRFRVDCEKLIHFLASKTASKFQKEFVRALQEDEIVYLDNVEKAHAEIKIKRYLEKECGFTTYIGISRLCCHGCQVQITEDNINSMTEGNEKIILARGCHNKFYQTGVGGLKDLEQSVVRELLDKQERIAEFARSSISTVGSIRSSYNDMIGEVVESPIIEARDKFETELPASPIQDENEALVPIKRENSSDFISFSPVFAKNSIRRQALSELEQFSMVGKVVRNHRGPTLEALLQAQSAGLRI